MKNFNLEEFLIDLDTELTTINLDYPNNSANMAVKSLSNLFKTVLDFFMHPYDLCPEKNFN